MNHEDNKILRNVKGRNAGSSIRMRGAYHTRPRITTLHANAIY